VRQILGTQVRKGSDTDGVDLVLVSIQFQKLTDTLILVFDDQKQIVNVDFPLGN
jgi:transposase-like protein